MPDPIDLPPQEPRLSLARTGSKGSSQQAVTQHDQIAEAKKEIENLIRILAGDLTSEAITTALVTKVAELKVFQCQLDRLQAQPDRSTSSN